MSHPVLQTPRLTLRAWSLGDLASALPIYGDPEVTRYIGGETARDLEEMRTQLQMRIDRSKSYGPGLGAWAAVAQGGEIVGTGLLKPLPDADRVPTADIEVGWHLARAHWGQGYATEIGRRLIAHGFASLALARIHAVVEPGNLRSQRVAQRLGMRSLGRTHAYYGLSLEHFAVDRAHGAQ